MHSWMRRGCRTATCVTLGSMPIAPAHWTALGMQQAAGAPAAVPPADGEWPWRSVGADGAVQAHPDSPTLRQHGGRRR